MPGRVHVVGSGDRWAVKVEGHRRAMFAYDTRKEAEFAARRRAMKYRMTLVLHNRTGSVEKVCDYGTGG